MGSHRGRLAVLGALLILATTAGGALAASHREAPLSSTDPVGDITDLYAWRSANNTVTFVMDTWPFEEPAGGPNFFGFGPDVRYEIHVDNNADARADLTYRWTFRTIYNLRPRPDNYDYNTAPVTSLSDEHLIVRQTYTLQRINWANGSVSTLGTNLPVPPVNIGPRSMPNYGSLVAASVKTLGDTKSFAGQRDDPFFVDLGAIFDLIKIRAPGVDTLKGFNVQSLVLQVPVSKLVRPGKPTIGIWATTKRRSTTVLNTDGSQTKSGPWVQISRLGNPLVNEVVIPIQEKDRFNASRPANDAQFLPRVLHSELAERINDLYPGVFNAPENNRQDLVAVFLTGVPGLNKPDNGTPSEMLRLNTSITPCTADRPDDDAGKCQRLGVLGGDLAGWPNGRRLTDDVVDIAEKAVGGVTYTIFVDPTHDSTAAATLGDNVNRNDKAFSTSFPYVAMPHQGYSHVHHGAGVD